MNEEYELQKLVLKNLEILEQSRKLLHDPIDVEFKKKLTALLLPHLEYMFPGWRIEIELEQEYCSMGVYLPGWYFEKAKAWCIVQVDFLEWEKYKSTLSYLEFCTNRENVQPGIYFNYNKYFTNKFSRKLEKEIQTLHENKRDRKRLKDAGFIFNDDQWYRPFQLEISTIARDWPNLTTDSIKPLLDAWRSVSEVKDIFDNLVQRITGRA